MPSKTRKTSSDKPKNWGTREIGKSTKKSSRPTSNSSRSSASAKPAKSAKSTKSTKNAPTSHRNNGPKSTKKKNRKKRSKHPIIKWILIIFAIFASLGIAAFAYLYLTTEVPNPEDVALAQKTTVYYSDGSTPIGSLAQQNREIIECSALPTYVGNSVVSSENRTFWTDNGLDLKGIGRALINNVTKGTRQGGSTITQQYAERYYLGQTESYIGKLREAILAVKIAQSQSKDAVLCNYMNTIYFGRDSYGIEAAAENYFGKSAKDLTYSEAALLTGIIPSPNNWDPAVNEKQAKSRWERTLKIMKDDNYITAKELDEAQFPTTITYTRSNTYAGYKGYLLQMVKNELTKNKTFTEDELETGGYSIISTLDAGKQATMQKVGETHLSGVPDGVQQGGISVDPRDGSVYAVYAGSDYINHPLNNATQAQFQPGSTMKPFALMAAAQKDVNFNTFFNGNSPRTFKGLQSSVSNAGGASYGNINLWTATAKSVNTVFMDLNESLTPQVTADTAHKAGITGDIDADSPYNVLGINGITAWDLAQGHSTIASGGLKTTLHIVKAVKNSDGDDLYKAKTDSTRVFTQDDSALVIKAMRGVVTSGTGREALSLGRPVAAKTGTSNDNTSVAFVGYIPQMVTVFGVWYPDANGNPQVIPSRFGSYGGSAYPAHLFTLYSKEAFQGLDVEQFPTATDTGKVGGPDGTYGLGASYGTTNNYPRDESKSDSDSDESKDAANSTTDNSTTGSGSGGAGETNPDTGSTTDNGDGANTDTETDNGAENNTDQNQGNQGNQGGTGTGSNGSGSGASQR